MTNQDIKCTVSSCKFNESAKNCTLQSINVGCDSTSSQPHDKCETNCSSFQCK